LNGGLIRFFSKTHKSHIRKIPEKCVLEAIKS